MGNLAGCFHSFLQVLEPGFLQKISHFDGKEGLIKLGKLLNLIKQDSFQYHCFDSQRAAVFSNAKPFY